MRIHRHSPLRRPAGLAGAAMVLVLLAGGPAAADEGGHKDDVAEWPEWAQTEDSDDGHSHDDSSPKPSPDEDGHDHGASAPPDPDDHATDDHGTDKADPDDHGTEGDSDHEEGAGDEGHGGHGDESGQTPQRPRALVLSSFAVVNGGVLLSAAFLRRRTKGEVQRRRSARAAALRDPDRPARTTRTSSRTP